MANSIAADVKKASGWSIALSVLMIVAGICAIAAPLIAGATVTTIVGWLLMLSGVFHLAFAWRAARPSGVLWEILLGVVYGGIGFYLLRSPLVGLASLTLVIAMYLFAEGILEIVLSIQHRPAPGSGWLLFDGIVTFVLALMIWSTWPSSAVWVIGTLVGISMIASGVTRVMLSMAVRRIVA